MNISEINVVEFTPRFPGNGYVMAHVTQRVLHDRLIRIRTDDGHTGYGEIVRKPTFDPQEVRQMEDSRLARLEGTALTDLPSLVETWRTKGRKLNGLAFAMETALLDLKGRASDMPLSSLLGRARMDAVPLYFSLSCGTPEFMAETAACNGSDHPVIQAKLGDGDMSMDRERIRAVLEVMKPDQIMLADYNGVLKPEEVIAAFKNIEDPRFMLEEPCPTVEENATVAAALDLPIMFDQCLTDIKNFERTVNEGVAAAVAIKPAFLGGLSVGRAARDLCIEAGMKVRIDGPWSGQVAACAALHLAVGAPRDLLICSANLIGPLDIADDMIVSTAPGYARPVSGPGLGDPPSSLVSQFQ